MNWSKLNVFITGGTGSFGNKFTQIMLSKHKPRKLMIFSRDEHKQYEMIQRFNDDPRLRFFVGDVRDRERLHRALQGVDVVIHAAALKHVPSCEYNPFEAVKTNILGAENLINASIDANVEKVVAISTDKAVNPLNLYGATKLTAEKMFIQSNSYVGRGKTRFSCVRYGNVIGSRGSVIPLFKRQAEKGSVAVTDRRMTRFWISIEQGVDFVTKSVERMKGGEVFVPKCPSMKTIDVARAIAPEAEIETIGIRPGEKLHEILITEEEARHALEFEDFFVIEPEFPWWSKADWALGKRARDGFRYASDSNEWWLSPEDLKKMLEEV